jgi:outer membrane receptor for ferrienterochelin and colicin
MLSRPATSIGFINIFQKHSQESSFGKKKYNASQYSINSNIVFETYILNTNHKLSSGLSFNGDKYDEIYNETKFLRNELVPGIFSQYSYTASDKFSLIAGIRADNHNLSGVLITPRLHLKYKFDNGITLRASAGKGYRTANIFADNIGVLASSRKINITEKLKIEDAWNYGLNFSKEFELSSKRKAHLGIDLYRTNFKNQVIADMENAGKVSFYNLKGKSYSTSFQTDAMIEPFKRFEITAAFRVNDVKATINDKLQATPYMSRYKGLLSLSYATKYEKWKFDFTSQFNGKSRIPDTSKNPEEFQLESFSKSYAMLYAQVTRKFRLCDVYFGIENLTGFTQTNPIIDAQNPFSDHFDASIVWGPLTGRMFYGGLRFKIGE